LICRSLSGYSTRTFFGGSHTYQFSAETAEASHKRVLEFFAKELGVK